MTTTRNQNLELKVQEHDNTLNRLEAAAGQNLSEIEGLKSFAMKNAENLQKTSENLSAIKEQLETQMNEILKLIQEQSVNNSQFAQNNNNNRVHNHHSGGMNHNTHNLHNDNNMTTTMNHNSHSNRLTKIDFPKFNGDNVEGWICKVEHFFAIDETPEQIKTRLAIVHLEDIALLWHQSLVQSRGGNITGMTWQEYKNAIIARFGLLINQDAMGQLASIRQKGSLEDLNREFDLALTRVNICDEYAVSLYLRALKPEIGYQVRMLRPKNLPEAYLLARMQDDALQAIHPFQYKGTRSSYNSNHNNNNNKPVTMANTNKLSLLPTPKPINSRRWTLTQKEIEEKRAKGECFGCTEKYSQGHVCKTKQLFSIELMENDESQEEEEMLEVPVVQNQEPTISLNAMTGVPSVSTMRVRGSIGTKTLHILTDSGSTHNFLNEQLAIKMNCPIKSIAEVCVTVADGNKVSCTKMCPNFRWTMQESK